MPAVIRFASAGLGVGVVPDSGVRHDGVGARPRGRGRTAPHRSGDADDVRSRTARSRTLARDIVAARRRGDAAPAGGPTDGLEARVGSATCLQAVSPPRSPLDARRPADRPSGSWPAGSRCRCRRGEEGGRPGRPGRSRRGRTTGTNPAARPTRSRTTIGPDRVPCRGAPAPARPDGWSPGDVRRAGRRRACSMICDSSTPGAAYLGHRAPAVPSRRRSRSRSAECPRRAACSPPPSTTSRQVAGIVATVGVGVGFGIGAPVIGAELGVVADGDGSGCWVWVGAATGSAFCCDRVRATAPVAVPSASRATTPTTTPERPRRRFGAGRGALEDVLLHRDEHALQRRLPGEVQCSSCITAFLSRRRLRETRWVTAPTLRPRSSRGFGVGVPLERGRARRCGGRSRGARRSRHGPSAGSRGASSWSAGAGEVLGEFVRARRACLRPVLKAWLRQTTSSHGSTVSARRARGSPPAARA